MVRHFSVTSFRQYYVVRYNRGKTPSTRLSVRYKRGVRYIRGETAPRDMKLGTL